MAEDLGNCKKCGEPKTVLRTKLRAPYIGCKACKEKPTPSTLVAKPQTKENDARARKARRTKATYEKTTPTVANEKPVKKAAAGGLASWLPWGHR